MIQLTKSPSGGLLGGQAPARVRHAPQSRANSWEDVSDLCVAYGLTLDAWQEDVLTAGLGERADGRWMARQVGVSTPRQNGKTMLIVARVLAGLLLFGEKIIIVSAHRQDTARETFSRLVQIIEDNPGLEERVDFIARSEMREFIRLKTGQEVRFKARSNGSGRGFSCDCLMLDEAQILGAGAWSAILPTMSARPNPQVWLLGTPPTENDDGEVFTRIRDAGIEGKASQIAYLEWSAERGDPVSDPQVWAKANPAYGTRIGYEAVEAEYESMSEDQFRMERLGMWADDANGSVVTAAQWASLAGRPESIQGMKPTALGVDMSHDRMLSVGACWVVGDKAHLEEVRADPDPADAVEWIAERAGRHMPVFIDSMSPAAALIPELKARRVNVHSSSASDMAKGCGLFEDRAVAGSLSHANQESISKALASARKRPIRDAGGWGWDRSSPSTPIYPLVAVTLALVAASGAPRRMKASSKGMVVLS